MPLRPFSAIRGRSEAHPNNVAEFRSRTAQVMVRHACRMEARRHRVEAGPQPLQVRQVRCVAEGQEPGLRAGGNDSEDARAEAQPKARNGGEYPNHPLRTLGGLAEPKRETGPLC